MICTLCILKVIENFAVFYRESLLRVFVKNISSIDLGRDHAISESWTRFMTPLGSVWRIKGLWNQRYQIIFYREMKHPTETNEILRLRAHIRLCKPIVSGFPIRTCSRSFRGKVVQWHRRDRFDRYYILIISKNRKYHHTCGVSLIYMFHR